MADFGRRRKLRWALVAGALVAAAGEAGAQAVRCGMVVEERVVLDRDLECPDVGLILRNPRSVVQLNGHTVTSLRSCDDDVATPGIVVEETAEGSLVLGPGLVRGFTTGIEVAGASRIRLRDLRISDSCADGLVVLGADDVRARALTLHRNGDRAARRGGAVHVEGAEDFLLEASTVAANSAARRSGTIDLRACHRCRVRANHVIGNRGIGLRLDTASIAAEVERNLVLDHRPFDIVDEGSANVFVLNTFERGAGVEPPALWPLPGDHEPVAPGVAGCGTMHAPVAALGTVTVICPQDAGLRALRNSVVAYRLMSPFDPTVPMQVACRPVELRPAGASTGGSITCTNPATTWSALLEVTCCLN